jgi:hypothetical protein
MPLMPVPVRRGAGREGGVVWHGEVATLHWRVAIMGAVVAVGLFTAGCNSGGPTSAPVRSPTPIPSVTPGLSASAAAERDALVAYRGMWNAWVEAGKISNPDAPALRTYASGEALKLIVAVLATNQHNRQVTLGNVAINPAAFGATPQDSPTEVTVKDCVNTENWLNHKASGGLVDNIPGGRRSMTATVARVADSWKVTAFKLGRVGTC